MILWSVMLLLTKTKAKTKITKKYFSVFEIKLK